MKTILVVLVLAIAALAGEGEIWCPSHSYAPCHDTGIVNTRTDAHLYSCTCGDQIWVR